MSFLSVVSNAKGVQPSLNLDFTKGVIDPRITFSRNSVGSYYDATGKLTIASANLPRFDYDPLTLKPKGVLVEEGRTNYIYDSQYTSTIIGQVIPSGSGSLPSGWSNYSSWDTVEVLDVRINSKGIRIIKLKLKKDNSASGSTAYPRQACTNYGTVAYVSNGQIWTASLVVNSFTKIQGISTPFFIHDGTGGSTSTYNLIDNITSDTKVSLSRSINTASGPYQERFSIAGNVAAGDILEFTVEISLLQLELGSFPTSYIPTVSTSPVIRQADILQMTGTNFSSWYNQSEGTAIITVGGLINNAANNSIAFSLNDNTSNNRLFLVYRHSDAASRAFTFTVTNGVNQNIITSTSMVSDGRNKAVVSFKSDLFYLYINGVLIGVTGTGTLPPVLRLQLGFDIYGRQLNGWIEKFQYYPKQLSSSQLQNLSAL